MCHFLPFLLVLPTIASIELGGIWIYVMPPAVYVALVAADRAFGAVSAPHRAAPHWSNTLATWLWVPLQLGLMAWILVEIHRGRFAPYEAIGLGIGAGLVAGGIGITDAHELIHRRAWWERLLGQVLLAAVSYHHFYIEHIHGHHRRAATPADPVTARRGESTLHFLPRAIYGSFVSAWALEAERLARQGRPAWSPRNRVLAGLAAEAALYAAVALFAGWLGVAFLLVKSFIAILLLETINYIEHYGLERREIAPGVYERYGPQHAWDSHYRFGNWLLFNLPNHANHHLHPGRRHDALVYEAAAPRLPVGYPLALILALLPPLWFRMIDPHLPPAGAKPAG